MCFTYLKLSALTNRPDYTFDECLIIAPSGLRMGQKGFHTNNMDLYEVFETPKSILKVCGLWPHHHKAIVTKVRGVASIWFQLIFCASMLAECVYSFNDLTGVLEVLTMLTSPLSYLVKQLIFYGRERDFLMLHDFLDDDTLKGVPRRFRGLINEPVRFAKVLGISYLISCFVTVTMIAMLPFMTEKRLPVQFTLFSLGAYWHWAMYLFQTCGLYEAAANNLSLDFTAVGAMAVVKGQICVLNQKIRQADLQSVTWKAYMDECVNHHNKIVLLVELLEKVFSTIILIQYLTSIMVICNIGFQLVIVEAFSPAFLLMLSFFVAMMVQLGMYCWFGNEIILNSFAIRDACYETDWINGVSQARAMLLLIMERSKRPLYLTAGKFSVLSLTSFTSVINSAYSFFALMQRMYRKSEGI